MMEIFLAGSDPELPRRYGKIKLTGCYQDKDSLKPFVRFYCRFSRLLEISLLSFFTLKDSKIDRGHFFDVQDYI